MTNPRITLLIPGQSPPQVTMAAVVFLESKNNFFLGPDFSKQSGSLPLLKKYEHCSKERSNNNLSDSLTKLKIWSPLMVLNLSGDSYWDGPRLSIRNRSLSFSFTVIVCLVINVRSNYDGSLSMVLRS